MPKTGVNTVSQHACKRDPGGFERSVEIGFLGAIDIDMQLVLFTLFVCVELLGCIVGVMFHSALLIALTKVAFCVCIDVIVETNYSF